MRVLRVRFGSGGAFAVVLLIAGSLTSCGLAKAFDPQTYYLSASGDNTAAGTSPGTAWRTLERASYAILKPGSRLLLEGGQRFTGQLTLGKADAGNAARPVLIGSYGTGRATIVGNTGSGILTFDTAGIDIRNLVIKGDLAAQRSGAGIDVYSDLQGNRKLAHVSIRNVDISGFTNGIAIGDGRGTSGFRGVWVSNAVLHNNLDAGLAIYGPKFDSSSPGYADEDVHVSGVTAFKNRGDPRDTLTSSGSGIVLGNVQNGDVTGSIAYDNGGSGGSTLGPVGIWTYDSEDVVISHNLSYGNRTANDADGDGFDLDQNTSRSYLEYNLSYDNDGAGYLIDTYQGNKAQNDNVVRFNISSGDARNASFYGGITVLGEVNDLAVYQNTVVMAPAPSQASPALKLGDKGLHGVTVRNNVFVTHQRGPIAVIAEAAERGALLQGNDYFSATGPWALQWGSTSYQSLPVWSSVSWQEQVDRRHVGLSVDPDFAGPVLELQARSVSEATKDGAGFALRSSSPLLRTGLALARLFDVRPGLVSYSGNRISARAPNIGAQ